MVGLHFNAARMDSEPDSVRDYERQHQTNSTTYPVFPEANSTYVFDWSRVSDQVKENFENHYSGFASKKSYKICTQAGIVYAKRCLGCIVCSEEDCGYRVRPHVNASPEHLIAKEGSCKNCGNVLLIQSCSALIIWRHGEDVGILEVKGAHNHVDPPVKKPDMVAMETLKRRVVSQPSAGPKKILTSDVQAGDMPIWNASSVFIQKDKLGYYRSKILEKEGNRVKDGNLFIELQAIATKWPGYVRKASLGEESLIVLQTNFMRKVMLDNLSHIAESGDVAAEDCFTCDTTYCILKDGMYLTSIICFAPVIGGWMPIYEGITAGLSVTDFSAFFLPVFEILHAEIPWEFWKFFKIVADFSLAQAEGFKQAYVNFVTESTEKGRRDHLSINVLREQATEMIKGCKFHFGQSVERVTRSRVIISKESEAQFKSLCFQMISAQTQELAQQSINRICEKWPQMMRWLNWWLQESVARMLFACFRDNERHWLTTSNPSESFNVDMQNCIGKGLSITAFVVGFHRYMEYYEARFESVKTGQISGYVPA